MANHDHYQVGLINAQSAKNKKGQIKDYILNNELDLLVITETWTKQGKRGRYDLDACGPRKNRDGNVCRFNVKHHQPRPRKKGGGVALLFNKKSNISVEAERYSPTHWAFEYLDLDLNINGNKVCLIIIYSPDSQSKFNDFIEYFEFLVKIATKKNPKNVLIVGDFNIHVKRTEEYQARKFNALLQKFGLKQHVQDVTRDGKEGEKSSILDLVISYTKDESFVSNVAVLKDQKFSDHNPVKFQLFLPAVNSGENHSTDVSEVEEPNDIQQDEALTRLTKQKKFIDFVLSPMKEKAVSELPGIGEKYEENLMKHEHKIDKVSLHY